MRHNLAGTSYKASADSAGDSSGCPTTGGCVGYELARDLDFNVDDDGSTWSGNSDEGYSLDADDSDDAYFPVQGGAGGWLPIGDATSPFAAVFDGNSHTISNLAIRRDQTHVGLFGAIGDSAAIRNLGLIDNLADYTGSSNGYISIGGLVGQQLGGSITASYATGAADGGGGRYELVGGLVGWQDGGSITASHATGVVAGGAGGDDRVGGLVGFKNGGLITASYATGAAAGGAGSDGYVGGLVGLQEGGSITASYATGAAAGGDGHSDEVGGLVGYQSGGSITASYATGTADGGAGKNDVVGGLVGSQQNSTITASYATGASAGGDGEKDYIGGLVGYQWGGGSITASYATGDVDGGDGNSDYVGGLVGRQNNGTITASYATGAAAGGDGEYDHVGGLVGFQSGSGSSITASYATGAAAGGDSGSGYVGRLVGYQSNGTITASYGFGRATEGSRVKSAGSAKPPGVDTAAQLTAANAGTAWEHAGSNTLGAWDFGDETQIPALNYGDYDSVGEVFDCGHFPANACGALLPGQIDQVEASASGPPAVEPGETARLAGSLGFGRVLIKTWSWRQLAGPEVALSNVNARETTFTAPATSTLLLFELTATDGEGRRYTDSISLAVMIKADRDGDGLIEIDSLLMLHNMRHNLAGTGYKSGAESVSNNLGCPDDTGCFGYELMRHLDFDGDKDGRTWSGTSDEGYSLDADDSDDAYFLVQGGAGGWLPIGNETSPFAAVFDGNSHTISNLAIRRDQTHVGLFGAIGGGASIRNLGLIDNLADYTGSSNNAIYIGGLVGQQRGGSITASYATGAAAGGAGKFDWVGGLVGRQNGGSITASYATAAADGGAGDQDNVGGLVGLQGGSITASYATGAADGGAGDHDRAGGLVGVGSGAITASYATGAADGGNGHYDSAGGLVGFQSGGSITASYATGAAAGSAGNNDFVGGLVGLQGGGSITASYATGVAAGGSGNSDYVGELVGWHAGGPITASYATGDAAGGDGDNDSVGGLVGYNSGPITASYATGAAAGGDGDNDRVGGLVGYQDSGDITASYGFGVAVGEVAGSAGSTKPVGTAAQLTAANAGPSWNNAGNNTLDAWDFGTETQIPALKYGDYDDGGAVFDCGQFPANACGTPLPGQQRDGGGPDLGPSPMADRDGDGLIEIDSLLMLHNMRHNLAGTSYKASAGSAGNSSGCPATGGCVGYELARDLDFNVDDDGSTWSGSADEGYTLDPDDSQADYFPVENGAGGWLPIGDETRTFVAVFDGNGHSIRNLAIRRDQTLVGLFGAIGGGAAIRNLGLIDNLADYTGSSDDQILIGGLAGVQFTSSITASYATGPATGGAGASDFVGGLVGAQAFGSITASYAAGAAAGGDGDDDAVGGLVGFQASGLITASYATGVAAGGAGNSDAVGGLVGFQFGSSITASYATGAADGGDGDDDVAGVLVGAQIFGSITASYGFGSATGELTGAELTGELGGLDGSTEPQGVSTAAQLTADNAGSSWNSADSNTLGAWDFGTEEQIPALNYANYDGAGAVFDCDPDRGHFPANACGSLLPGQVDQVDASANGPSAVEPGETVRLVGSLGFGRALIETWSWRQLEGPSVTLSDANARETTFTAPAASTLLVFELTATDSGGRQYTDRISLAVTAVAVPDTVVILSGPEPADATAIVGNELSLVYSYSADDLRGRVLAGNIEVAAAVDDVPVVPDTRVDEAGGEITVVLLRQKYPYPGEHELVVSLSAAAEGFVLGGPSSITTPFSFLPLPPTVLEVMQAEGNEGKRGAVGSDAIELGYSFEYAADNRLDRPRAGLVVQVDFELCTDAGYGECNSLPAASMTLTLDDSGSLALRVDRTAAALSVFGEADADSIRHGRVLLSTADDGDFAATAAATTFSFAVAAAVVTLSGPEPADATAIVGNELILVYSYSADDLRGRVLAGNIEVAAAVDDVPVVPDTRVDGAGGEITVVLQRQTYPDLDEHELVVSLSAAAEGFVLGGPSSITTPFSFLPLPPTVLEVMQAEGNEGKRGAVGSDAIELGYSFEYAADNRLDRPRAGLVVQVDFELCTDAGYGECNSLPAASMTLTLDDSGSLALRVDRTAAALSVFGEADADSIRHGRVLLSTADDGDFAATAAATTFSFAVAAAVVTLSGPEPADATAIVGNELILVYSYSADDLRGRVLAGNIEVAAAVDDVPVVPDTRVDGAGGEITVVLQRQTYPDLDEHELVVSLSAAAEGFVLGGPSSITTPFSFLPLPPTVLEVMQAEGNEGKRGAVGSDAIELGYSFEYAADNRLDRPRAGLVVQVDFELCTDAGYGECNSLPAASMTLTLDDSGSLALRVDRTAAALSVFGEADADSIRHGRVLLSTADDGDFAATAAATTFSFAVAAAVVTLSGPEPADATAIVGNELILVYSYSADDLRGRVLAGNIEVAAAVDDVPVVPDTRVDGAGGEITVVLQRQTYPDLDEHELVVSLSAAAEGFVLGGPSSITTPFSFLPLPPTVLEVMQAEGNEGKRGAVGSDAIELGYSFEYAADNRLDRPRAGLVVQVDFELCTDAGYGECNSLPAASMTLTLDDSGSLALRVDRTAAALSVFGEADADSIRHGRVLLSTADDGDFAATAAATTFSFAVAAAVVTLSGPEPADATAIVGNELILVYSYSADDLRGRVLAGNIEVAAAVDDVPVVPDTRVDGAGGEITVVLQRQTYPDPDEHELVVSLSAAAEGFVLGEPSSITTPFSFLPLPPTVLEVMQAEGNEGKRGAVGSDAIELGYSFEYAADNRLDRPRAGLPVQVDFELCTDAGYGECSSLPAASMTLTLDDGGSLALRVDRTAAALSVFGEADADSIRHGRVLLSTADDGDFAATAAATTFSFAVAAAVVTLSGPLPEDATAIAGNELILVYSYSVDDLRGRVLAGNIEVAAAVDDVPVVPDTRVDGAGGEITVVLQRQTYPDLDEHELVVSLSAAAEGFVLGEPSSITTPFSFLPLPPTVLEVMQAEGNEGKRGAVGSDAIELGYSFEYAADNRLDRPRAGLPVQVDFELCTDAGYGECSSLPAASMTLTLDDGGSLALRVDRTAAALSVFGEADADSIRHGRVLLSTADDGDFAATAAATTFSFAVAAAVVTLGLEGAATAAEGTRVRVSAELTSVATEMTVVRLVVVAGGAGAATTADIGVEGDDFRVVIAAGAASGTTEFTVLDDDVDEGDETLGISIREGEAASDQIIEVTILDNDTRGVEISATTLDLTAGGSGIYTVVLTSQPTAGSVEVIPASSDSARVSIGEITAGSMPSDLVFSPENWNITRTVQVTTSSDPDARDNEVEITHQVVADADVDYAAEVAANVVVRVVAGAALVFELEETTSVAVFLEKSIPVKFFSDGSGGSSGGPIVVVLEAPDDLAVKFDEDAGDYGAITLRRLSEEPDENGERSREVKLVVLGAQGGRTVITIDVERLAPLPEIEISEIQSHLLLLPLGQSRPLAASLKGGAVAGVMWRVEVSRGDSVEVNEINEQGSFTVTASSYKTGESELKLSAFDDNGRRRERSFPVVVAAAEAKPRLKLSAILPDPLDPAKTAIVSGFAVNDGISIEATLEGAVPSVYDSGANLSFRITIAKLGADGMPEGDVVQLTAAAQVEGGGAPALRIEPVPVGAQMIAGLSLKVEDLVQVSIGHLVDGEVSARVIAGDALLLQVLATAIVDGDNDGLSDAVSGEDEPDTLGGINAAIVGVTDGGVNLPEGAVTVSLSLGDLARSLSLGNCGGVSLTLALGAVGGLTGCGDANLIDQLAIKTLTMTAQEQFGDGDYQLFDFSATFDSSEVDPGEFLVISLPVDPKTHRVYRFAAETAMWAPVIGAGLSGQSGIGGQGVLDSTDGCKTCFYALDVDRDGSVELLLLFVPLVPEDPGFAVDPSFQGRRIDIDAGDKVAPTIIPLLGLGELTATVTGNAYVEGRYIQTATSGGVVGPAVELRGLKRTRNGPEQVVVEAFDDNGEAVATITLEVSVRNQAPEIEFRLLSSGEPTTSIAMHPNTEMVLVVMILDPDGDTDFDLELTGGGDIARLEPGANPTVEVDSVSGGAVVINRLILTSRGARPSFNLRLEATDRTDQSKVSGRLTVCVNDTGECPTAVGGGGGTGSGSGGGGGSTGPRALVALALPLLLGWRRRRRRLIGGSAGVGQELAMKKDRPKKDCLIPAQPSKLAWRRCGGRGQQLRR